VLLETDIKLGGCAVGDFDPTHPGNEVAAVASDGSVYIVRRVGEGWEHEVIARFPGELIQCAGGDLAVGVGADELVAVGAAQGGEDDGGAGVAYAIVHDGTGFRTTRVALDAALLHAVAVGDIDPARPGLELLVAGYGRNLLLLHDGEHGVVSQSIGRLPGDAKGAAAGLGGAVVVCADGSLVRVGRDGARWSVDVLAKYETPLARVAATDEAVLFSANDGVLRLWHAGNTDECMHAPDRLRGAVIAPVDPLRREPVFATAGYDGRVTVVWPRRDGAPYVLHEVGQDTDRFHHLTSGELPGLGLALVACGYSGRVLAMVGERP
jgi:hypothetical protein